VTARRNVNVRRHIADRRSGGCRSTVARIERSEIRGYPILIRDVLET